MEVSRNGKKVVLGVSILAMFIFVVSAVSAYIQSLVAAGELCGCIIPISMFIPLLSSAGVFVGTLVYYLMAERVERKERGLKDSVEATLIFLQRGEREVLKRLIDAGGEATQASLTIGTDLGKVQVFRIVQRLRERGVIEKEPKGKTNTIRLTPKLRGLFAEDGKSQK